MVSLSEKFPSCQKSFLVVLEMRGQYSFPKTRYFSLFLLERALFSRALSHAAAENSCYLNIVAVSIQ